MSFQSDAYPYRMDRAQFPRRLAAAVDANFTEIESVRGHSRRTLGGRRCRLSLNHGPLWQQLTGFGEARMTCDYSATLSDKSVARALLRGWSRQVSDRYLDRQAVRAFTRRRFTSTEQAYETVSQNAPAGAVKFLYNELPTSTGDLALFGANLSPDLTYNQYFSRLIAWDDAHCFGLVVELSRLNNQLQLGGGSAVHPALQAATLWIFRNQTENPRSIYHEVANG